MCSSIAHGPSRAMGALGSFGGIPNAAGKGQLPNGQTNSVIQGNTVVCNLCICHVNEHPYRAATRVWVLILETNSNGAGKSIHHLE